MCGRYHIDDGRDSVELRDIIAQVNRRAAEAPVMTSGDIRPADVAPVMASSRRMTPAAFAMRWGYVLSDGRRVINARSETAHEKPLFRDGMKQRRCAVPATHYYEWARGDGRRTRYAIRPADGGLFYMAGIYRLGPEAPEFCILTRAPAESIAFIHDRMPVILPRELLAAWIDPRQPADELLARAVLSVCSERAEAGEQLAMPL